MMQAWHLPSHGGRVRTDTFMVYMSDWVELQLIVVDEEELFVLYPKGEKEKREFGDEGRAPAYTSSDPQVIGLDLTDRPRGPT